MERLRFEHFYDALGRVTNTNNQEGGLWQFDKSEAADGTETTTSWTPNTMTTITRLEQQGAGETVRVNEPSGEFTTNSTAADGLKTTRSSSCGMTSTTQLDLDRRYGYSFPQQVDITSPAGLHRKTKVQRDYLDQNLDGLPEQVTTQTSVNGRTTTLIHDVEHSRLHSISPAGRTVTTSYDPQTMLPLTIDIPGLNTTSYSYFANGRPQSVTTGARTSSYTYDSLGNLSSVTAPDGKVTLFTAYDQLGRLLQTERPDGSVISYNYDANGNLTVLTTPTPADNSFTYTQVSKLKTSVSPLGSTTSYRYNAERQLLGITLPSGRTIDNTYVNGQLTATTTAEGTTSYQYGCGDLVSSITRGGEAIGFSYDGSLPIQETRNGTVNATFDYSYDNDFRLSAMTVAGTTIGYGYDNDGLLTSAGSFTIGRNADNGLPESVNDGTFDLQRIFNGYGELSTISTTVSGSTTFGYSLSRDQNGRITAKVETMLGQNINFAYIYDELGRLLTVSRDGILVEQYSYDANGNRISETNTALSISDRQLSFSIEDHTIKAGDITYQYDLDDHLAARIEGNETTQYFYASTGELQQVIQPDNTEISYINDPEGRRIAKEINGTITQKYLWSDSTTLLAVYDASDTLEQRFLYADGRLPYALVMHGAAYYLHYDQVGSLRLITDSLGTAVKEVEYDSFGDILRDSNPAFTIPFGFAGGLYDPDTKLVRFGHRDYLPEIGKWSAKDPIGFAGGDTNLFGYVQNDPVNFVDPNEQWAVGAVIGAGAGAIGGFKRYRGQANNAYLSLLLSC
ncbi:RHS repeat domain-containing protein [Desulfobacterota bacterium M19]